MSMKVAVESEAWSIRPRNRVFRWVECYRGFSVLRTARHCPPPRPRLKQVFFQQFCTLPTADGALGWLEDVGVS